MRLLRRKLLQLVPVLLIVSFATFALLNLLPGDISLQLLGNDATPEAVARIRQELQLDDPLIVRYGRWAARALGGDLGRSHITGEAVMQALARSLPVSLELMALSLVVSLTLAIPAGLIAAYRAGEPVDTALSSLAALLLSAPNFIIAPVLVYVMALSLQLLPTVGYVPLAESVAGNLRSFALPALTLALVEWPGFMRILRSDAIATLQQDYVLFAKAKGLRNAAVLFRHVLKPSSFTLLTAAGLTVAALIGGALIVETIFALPGVGRLLVDAIHGRDFMIVQGAVSVIAVGFVLVNFAVDLLYAALDPRVTR